MELHLMYETTELQLRSVHESVCALLKRNTRGTAAARTFVCGMLLLEILRFLDSDAQTRCYIEG